MSENNIRLLCLGDSYTIGEAVASTENFPSQTITILQNEFDIKGEHTIIAKTGWTTDELIENISKKDLAPIYDFVTLLIGVNNQYRGYAPDVYKMEFEKLLNKAIGFAGHEHKKVFAFSIPDWSVTPFAADRDRQKIFQEIDLYNNINLHIAKKADIQYINITSWTREAVHDPELLTSDGLHPSGKEYKRWAEKLAGLIHDQKNS